MKLNFYYWAGEKILIFLLKKKGNYISLIVVGGKTRYTVNRNYLWEGNL